MYKQLVRLLNAELLSATPACFSDGYDSPVNTDSSANKLLESIMMQSPGITSPAFNCTISPGTTFSTGISEKFPFRLIFVVSLTSANNFFTALPALYS